MRREDREEMEESKRSCGIEERRYGIEYGDRSIKKEEKTGNDGKTEIIRIISLKMDNLTEKDGEVHLPDITKKKVSI